MFILQEIYENVKGETAMDPREIIQEAIDYVDENLLFEISGPTLAAQCGYSYMHFCRLFREHTGLMPKEYIRRRRLLSAVYEMPSGATKLDLAVRYGFSTYAGFYKAFRREFGMSPSVFLRTYPSAKPHRINLLQEEQIMVSKTRIRELLSRWGVEKQKITNVINENTGRQLENAYYVGSDKILKISANLAAAEKAVFFGEAIKTLDGKEIVPDGDLLFVLVKRIPGHHLRCAEIFENPALAQEIGRQIALLHQRLRVLDAESYRKADLYSDCTSALSRVKDLVGLSDDFIKDYTENFGRLEKKLPRQLIHRDLNPSVMIFENGEFRGFSDFELSEVNIRIFDLCYCATAILSECFDHPQIDKSCWGKMNCK